MAGFSVSTFTANIQILYTDNMAKKILKGYMKCYSHDPVVSIF
jgi:hypothetical protein